MGTVATDFYWVVGDTNPNTQVWQGSTGAFVSNTLAAYLTWVTANGMQIASAANNGAGLIRITLSVNATNQVFGTGTVEQITGTGGVADGTWTLTYINDFTYDLQGSTFTATFTGFLSTATNIDTAVHLYAFIDTCNQQFVPPAYETGTSAVANATFQLANTPPTIFNYTPGALNQTIQLPQMNLIGSYPLGKKITIFNNNTVNVFTINLAYSDGVPIGDVPTLLPGEWAELVPTVNDTPTGRSVTGTVLGKKLVPMPLGILEGGTGNTAIPAPGQVAVGDASLGIYDPQTISGDGTLSAAGHLTVSSVNGKSPISWIGRQVITATQVYTPTSGTTMVNVRLMGGGGGSGGNPATGAGQISIAGGGGGGGYAEKRITSAFSGVTVTIGAGGTAGASGAHNGGNGGTTSFGAIFSATGGIGGTQGAAAGVNGALGAAAGGDGSGGDINGQGEVSVGPFYWVATGAQGTKGGSTQWGSGGSASGSGGAVVGVPGAGFGAGAGGGSLGNSQAANAGAAGAPGICVIDEYQ